MSPGMDMLVRGLAFTAVALLTANYYSAAGLLSMGGIVPALVIGVGCLLVEMYLPRAEYYVESQM
jgi:hypothetical protein